MAEQAAVEDWGPGKTAVTENPTLYLSRMAGVFFTRGGGDQKLGMTPFAAPGRTSKGVGVMGRQQQIGTSVRIGF